MNLRHWFTKTEYQLLEPLGEGLTSRVYKAIRKHRSLNVEQTVALKILRSKNEVLALKNEIKTLVKIKSPHCVQFLGWEDLPQGRALVLEYLEGVSLLELCLGHELTQDLVEEILAQVQDGLRDLSRHQVWHGDLSARNIFVTTEGVVKLLDFGFCGRSGSDVYATPQYLAPEIWLGQPTSSQSDLFSLGLLREDLLSRQVVTDKGTSYWKQRALDVIGKNSLLKPDPSQREPLPLESQKLRREDLGHWVQKLVDYRKNVGRTQRLEPEIKRTFPRLRLSLSWGLTVLCMLFCHQLQTSAGVTTEVSAKNWRLEVRSVQWASVVLYEKRPDGALLERRRGDFTPSTFSHLPAGEYELEWHSRRKTGRVPVSLYQNSRVIIRAN